MEQWTTIINKPELIEEIRKAPDDRFSFIAAVQEVRVISKGYVFLGTQEMRYLYTDCFGEIHYGHYSLRYRLSSKHRSEPTDSQYDNNL